MHYSILFLQVQETTVRDNSHKKGRRNSSTSAPSSVKDKKMEWKDRDDGREEKEARTDEEHSEKGENRMPRNNVDDNRDESNIRMAMEDEEGEELDCVSRNMIEGSARKSRQSNLMEKDYRNDNESNISHITNENEEGNREEWESRMTMRLEDDRVEEANRLNMNEANDQGVRRRKRWCTRVEGGEDDEYTERINTTKKQEHGESNPNNDQGESARHKVWEARLEKYTPSLLILAFLIFNLVYWPYWLNRHTHKRVQDLDS